MIKAREARAAKDADADAEPAEAETTSRRAEWLGVEAVGVNAASYRNGLDGGHGDGAFDGDPASAQGVQGAPGGNGGVAQAFGRDEGVLKMASQPATHPARAPLKMRWPCARGPRRSSRRNGFVPRNLPR